MKSNFDKKIFINFIIILGLFSLGIGIRSAFNIGTQESSKHLANNSTVNASPVDQIQFSAEEKELVMSGESYFVNYRLKREQSRQETKEMLSLLLDSSVEETKEKAQKKWLELSFEIEKESEIENLLKIKGFRDAVADVNENGVNVIIYAPSLNENEIKLIQDIVIKGTNMNLNQISISYKS